MWKVKGLETEVKEIWEDFFGNLYFVTEHIDDDIKFGFVRLYHMPHFAEWGNFSLDEIKKSLPNPNMVWMVDKQNWGNIESYEKGLLVEA